jgi:hypothetical protein
MGIVCMVGLGLAAAFVVLYAAATDGSIKHRGLDRCSNRRGFF